MIQFGARSGVAEPMKAFQSSRLEGAKILVPTGQLFFSIALLTLRQFIHFKSTPGLYLFPEAISTFLHTHPLGLPFFGLSDNFLA
jgi:hypothetical protein